MLSLTNNMLLRFFIVPSYHLNCITLTLSTKRSSAFETHFRISLPFRLGVVGFSIKCCSYRKYNHFYNILSLSWNILNWSITLKEFLFSAMLDFGLVKRNFCVYSQHFTQAATVFLHNVMKSRSSHLQFRMQNVCCSLPGIAFHDQVSL